ncbi:helix-turn-helix domain-containing protein, partial [Halobellus sp. Atlit-31R]
LSEVLDISPTAVSGRIRRGTAELVESILLDE